MNDVVETSVVQVLLPSSPPSSIHRSQHVLLYSGYALYSAVRNDPVAWPILQDLLRNASPAMITLLFQLYAVNVQDITQKGKRVTEALSAGTASWNYADGLWIGAFDFGRAFISTLTSYKQGAEAFVGYCEGRVSTKLLSLIRNGLQGYTATWL